MDDEEFLDEEETPYGDDEYDDGFEPDESESPAKPAAPLDHQSHHSLTSPGLTAPGAHSSRFI